MMARVPKNFAQDVPLVAADVLGTRRSDAQVRPQVTVADVRDGALSSSTLKEASSWGKVDTVYEQMVTARRRWRAADSSATALPQGGVEDAQGAAWSSRCSKPAGGVVSRLWLSDSHIASRKRPKVSRIFLVIAHVLFASSMAPDRRAPQTASVPASPSSVPH